MWGLKTNFPTKKAFTKHLRRMFSTFGSCQEIATDRPSVFTGGLTQTFLKSWDVKHCLSFVANPHSNYRAELAVKSSEEFDH